MQRYLSIDILRGLAIILMIQVHFVDNLSSRPESWAWLYDASVFFGMLPAPLFAFVSGVSYGLWLRKQQSAKHHEREITLVSLRRGVFLFVLGLLFNCCVWLPEETFNWDILTTLGFAFIVLAFARHLPSPVLGLGCVVLLLLSPPVRVVSDFMAYWEDESYAYDFTVRDITFGFVANGYFPVFPWLIFPLVGFLCTDLVFQERTRATRTRWWLGLVGGGMLGFACLLLLVGTYLPTTVSQYYAFGLTEFPASTEYVLGTLGLAILGLVGLHRWVDQNQHITGTQFGLTMLRRFSAYSLTVYVLHHIVILWPLWLYGAWHDRTDWTCYWREALPTPWSFSLSIVFIVLCHWLLKQLERRKIYPLESLLRRFCD